MSASPRQLELLGKADSIIKAIDEALSMPECKYIGVCPAIRGMNGELSDVIAALRGEITPPRTQAKNNLNALGKLKGGGTQ